MGYPLPSDEARMLRTHAVEPPTVRPVLSPPDVTLLQATSARVHVDEDLLSYAVGLTGFTRTHPRVALGCSPRATLGLVQAAKACALVAGRTFVTPDDIRAVAPSVLAHRLVLTADAEGDPKARARVIDEALKSVGYRRAAHPAPSA
jgi:MoxR-like ATPase